MADPPADPDTGEDTRTPRWVKVFGAITIVVVLLFVILLFTRGRGGHGPRRHTSYGDTRGGGVPPRAVTISYGFGPDCRYGFACLEFR